MWRFVALFSSVLVFVGVQSDSCLRELPISQLLRIKRSIEKLNCDSNECSAVDIKPVAANKLSDDPQGDSLTPLPLRGLNLRQSHDPWDEKPSKIQTVFELSITALSFLAFGGYLLCMIVQAIKSKGTTYYHPTTSENGIGNGNTNVFRKVKVYKRSRRSDSAVNSSFNMDMLATPSPDELYRILAQAAEGYVKIY